MKIRLSLDKAGRIVLPQAVRRQFRLLPGDRLDIQVRPDGILLRSRHQRPVLVEENGLLVHEGEASGDLAQAVDLSRSDRDAALTGIAAP